MPDPTKYDLDYRPSTYWRFADRMQRVLATVKGSFRRRMAGLVLGGGDETAALLGSTDPLCFDESLTPAERHRRMSVDPEFASGEFLPDLCPGEVEIARVSYNSTMSDVVSVRARPLGDLIWYGIVDDFSGDGHSSYLSWAPVTSKEPLTLRELIGLMDSATQITGEDVDGIYTGLVQGPSLHQYVCSGCSVEWILDARRFSWAESAFYDQLESWYCDVDDEMCLKYLEMAKAHAAKSKGKGAE